jgi:transcriptional regulator of heat shock response
MPKKSNIDPETNLTIRQKNILFSVIKEYCDYGVEVGSKELKDKYRFSFSYATIRNELAVLRDLGYLFQPFLNAGSKPTDKAFRLFVNQLIVGLQATSQKQQELKKQILEMESKQLNLSKEISRLLAVQTGGAAFSVGQMETVSGMANLLENPGDGKVADILDFLDNLDTYKPHLLSGETANSKDGNEKNHLNTVIGNENPVLPLGKGYAMVTTEVFLSGGGKEVVGLITPIHLLAKEKNLELLDAISKVLGKKGVDNNI